jgi:hypothetical protein
MPRMYRAGLLAAIPLALAVGGAAAQTSYPNVRVAGRAQVQFYHFDNSDYASTTGPRSSFYSRRMRIEARGQINEYVSVYVMPSFEGGRAVSGSAGCAPVVVDGPLPDTVTVTCSVSATGGVRLRDAWIDVRLTQPEARTAFTIRAGQEKRPFSRYELTSSNNLPSIERGGGRGLLPTQSNDLFTAAGFAAHDVGAHLRVERKLDQAGRRASLVVGVYNGRGESVNDNNSAKTFGARVNADVWQKLSLGANVVSHDQIVGTDSAFRNTGWGVDAQWSKPGEPGLFVLAEYLRGERPVVGKPTMHGVQAVAAWHHRMASPTSWLYAVEPSLRIDVADPDVDVDDNGATLLTAALGLYLSSRAQVRVAYERQSFQAPGASPISGIRSALTVNF